MRQARIIPQRIFKLSCLATTVEGNYIGIVETDIEEAVVGIYLTADKRK